MTESLCQVCNKNKAVIRCTYDKCGKLVCMSCANSRLCCFNKDSNWRDNPY